MELGLVQHLFSFMYRSFRNACREIFRGGGGDTCNSMCIHSQLKTGKKSLTLDFLSSEPVPTVLAFNSQE